MGHSIKLSLQYITAISGYEMPFLETSMINIHLERRLCVISLLEFMSIHLEINWDNKTFDQCYSLLWLQEEKCQYRCSQIMYSTSIHIIPDELLVVCCLQQLPSAHPTPQAGWVLNEIRKKRNPVRQGNVSFPFHQ